MPRRRIRRPLVALVALVLALAIGYGVRAARSDGVPPPYQAPTITVPVSAAFVQL